MLVAWILAEEVLGAGTSVWAFQGFQLLCGQFSVSETAEVEEI
jgi:hypothetical protein